jgi:type IV pilus assembly protein PilE
MTKNKSGFTLIELIVAVAIIGILAAIAIPSYQESVQKSRRKDAQGALTSFANAMERQFTATGSYCNAATTDVTAGGVTCTNATGIPTIFSATSPVDGGTPAYNLDISVMNAGGTTFTLRAVPTGVQAGDTCGTMTLTSLGVQAPGNNCW